MASIILPRCWQSQPQYLVEIDWNNTLVTGVVQGVFASPTRAATIIGNVVNTSTTSINTFGTGVKLSGSTGYIAQSTTATAAPWSILAFGAVHSLSADVAVATHAESPGNTTLDRSLTVTTNGYVRAYLFDGAAKVATNTNKTIAVNEPVLVGAVGSGSAVVAYANKTSASTNTSNFGFTGYSFPELVIGYGGAGASGGSSAQASNSSWAWVLKWNRALTQAEVSALADNPWQIFRPQRRILYFDNGGVSTNTYTYSGDADIAFSGTATTTWQKLYSFSGDADITFSGTATTAYVAGAVTYPYNGSGTLTFSGTATTAWLKLYSFNGDADITFSGAATTAYVPVGSTTYSYSGDGSITFSGTATTVWLQLFSYAGSGTLTFSGDATTAYVPGLVEYAYNGSGTIVFSGTAETSGPKLADTERVGVGGTSTVSVRPRRQKLILVERVEDVEELLEQVEEIVQQEPKRKVEKKAKKPTQTVQEAPQAAFDWLAYYDAQLERLRDQQRANALRRQLERNAEIIRAIVERHEQEAQLAQQLRDEEDLLLLLMAA